MADLDAQAALARAQATTSNAPGGCLGYLYQNFGSVQSIGDHAGQYPIALNGWLYSTAQHPDDTNPPAGAPVYFGVSPTRHDRNAGAGDVAQSVGGGVLWASDVHGAGVPGLITIAARAAQTQRPYLGWTGDFLGHNLVNLGSVAAPASDGGAPISSGYVASYQTLLNQHGANLVVDGIRGPKTIAAVRAYQASSGLTVDGIVGPQTLGSLNAQPAPAPAPSGLSGFAEIQAALNQFGYGLAVDGIWGPRSHAALGNFQATHGLTVDYLVGPNTRRALGI